MSYKTLKRFGRPAHEFVASFFWLSSSLLTALFGYYGNFGIRFPLLASIPMFIFGCVRLYQGIQVSELKVKCIKLPPLKMTIYDLHKMATKNPDMVYYGHGYVWERLHAELANKFTEAFLNTVEPSKLYLKISNIFRSGSNSKVKGKTYLHAIGGKEQPIMRPKSDRVAHRILAGASGSGKGRAIALDLVQAIFRKEPTIIIDPKKDDLLKHLAYASCVLSGQKNKFHYFDPTKPICSVRLDLLSHYTDLEELTTRVTDIVPPSDDEQFKQFAWRAINTVVHVLSACNERITLRKIRLGLENEVALLVRKMGVHLLNQHPRTRDISEAITRQVDVHKGASMAIDAYRLHLESEFPSDAMNQVISVYSEDQKHYRKLMQNVLPLIIMLTQGEYRSLLSPEYDDDDPRPIVNLRRLDERGEVLYVNTAALKDNAVGSALGSLFMNDTIGLVSDRYYFNIKTDNCKETVVNVFCDESGDILNHNSMNLINKSRGANCHFTVACQSLSDIQKRLGSPETLNIMMGSASNKSQARSEDPFTRELMSLQMGTTSIQRLSKNHMTQSVAQRADLSFNTSYSTAVNTEKVQIVSEDSFKGLADLHLFMQVAGTYLYKIRVPYVEVPKELEYHPQPYQNSRFGAMPAFEDVGQKSSDDLAYLEETDSQAA